MRCFGSVNWPRPQGVTAVLVVSGSSERKSISTYGGQEAFTGWVVSVGWDEPGSGALSRSFSPFSPSRFSHSSHFSDPFEDQRIRCGGLFSSENVATRARHAANASRPAQTRRPVAPWGMACECFFLLRKDSRTEIAVRLGGASRTFRGLFAARAWRWLARCCRSVLNPGRSMWPQQVGHLSLAASVGATAAPWQLAFGPRTM
jgi:hypothetical protein